MTRTFIWGSCVSRDTIEFLPAWELARYVARQSMLSAGTDTTGLVQRPLFDSAFQQRMSDWDLAGSALKLVEDFSEVDRILLDLCDERLGVIEVAQGNVLTRSVERIVSGVDTEWGRHYRHLPFGIEEHYERWEESMLEVRDYFRDLGILDRTLVISLPWATHTEAGEATPSSFGLRADQANILLGRYLRAMESAGFHLVGTNIEPLGSRDHQWGAAPFHYATSTYEALAAELSGSA